MAVHTRLGAADCKVCIWQGMTCYAASTSLPWRQLPTQNLSTQHACFKEQTRTPVAAAACCMSAVLVARACIDVLPLLIIPWRDSLKLFFAPSFITHPPFGKQPWLPLSPLQLRPLRQAQGFCHGRPAAVGIWDSFPTGISFTLQHLMHGIQCAQCSVTQCKCTKPHNHN